MTADTVGGVWSYALELCRALCLRGVCVELATLGAPLSDAQWQEARALPGLTVHESTWRLEWMDAPWDDVRAAGEWLLALEARLSPDVVHLNGYCHGAWPFRAPVLVVAHSCVLSWWEAVKGGAAPARYHRYREEVAKGLHAASVVVAPTRAMLDAIERHYGDLHPLRGAPNAGRTEDVATEPAHDSVPDVRALPAARGTPAVDRLKGIATEPAHDSVPDACALPAARGTPNAGRAEDVAPGQSDDSAPRARAFPSARVIPNARCATRFPPSRKERFVLAAGRLWDEAKNLAALEAAAPQLPFPVHVAGDALHPEGGAVAETRSTRPLGHLPPSVLAQWMARAPVYALPARYEPFGLSALEAALAGCALVLGDIPSLREVWGDAARFVPPDDSRALARTLRFLMDHPREREALAARGRERALTFTPDRMAEAYLELYASLARLEHRVS
ncbi:glycosyltransferase family 4 protein [Corallococcus exercitus]|uniref:Glycosyltransferase family 4 protein n=2 Tax=Corallococcus exercitus TaxID=2316736 RepID=A0A7Y4KP15_9BACT|nr:glycosyltransferase family 4 protein [Corallococcus exercitus]NOK37276.1 glycosyltransferase family 4 protein [Corallococcus exercitus]